MTPCARAGVDEEGAIGRVLLGQQRLRGLQHRREVGGAVHVDAVGGDVRAVLRRHRRRVDQGRDAERRRIHRRRQLRHRIAQAEPRAVVERHVGRRRAGVEVIALRHGRAGEAALGAEPRRHAQAVVAARVAAEARAVVVGGALRRRAVEEHAAAGGGPKRRARPQRGGERAKATHDQPPCQNVPPTWIARALIPSLRRLPRSYLIVR